MSSPPNDSNRPTFTEKFRQQTTFEKMETFGEMVRASVDVMAFQMAEQPDDLELLALHVRMLKRKVDWFLDEVAELGKR